MPLFLPNGAGESLGDVLAMVRPLQLSGNMWFVNSASGTDAVSPAGQNKEKPLATLSQAITNAADNDIIVLQAGHAEAITGLTVSKKLCIIGGGLAAGRPTVKLRGDSAGNPVLFTVSGTQVEFRNIWFQTNSQVNTSARIVVSGSHFRMVGCYVECSGTDEAQAVTLGAGADSCRIVNTTFISTATSTADQPHSAIKITAAISDLELDGLVLSAGTVGFSNYAALDGTAAAITRLKGQSVSLLLGADVALHASTTGWLNVGLATGGSRVSW